MATVVTKEVIVVTAWVADKIPQLQDACGGRLMVAQLAGAGEVVGAKKDLPHALVWLRDVRGHLEPRCVAVSELVRARGLWRAEEQQVGAERMRAAAVAAAAKYTAVHAGPDGPPHRAKPMGRARLAWARTTAAALVSAGVVFAAHPAGFGLPSEWYGGSGDFPPPGAVVAPP